MKRRGKGDYATEPGVPPKGTKMGDTVFPALELTYPMPSIHKGFMQLPDSPDILPLTQSENRKKFSRFLPHPHPTTPWHTRRHQDNQSQNHNWILIPSAQECEGQNG